MDSVLLTSESRIGQREMSRSDLGPRTTMANRGGVGISGVIMTLWVVPNWTEMTRPLYSHTDQSLDSGHHS